jgi:hypothetical protein
MHDKLTGPIVREDGSRLTSDELWFVTLWMMFGGYCWAMFLAWLLHL